jgi:hypothetical protein
MKMVQLRREKLRLYTLNDVFWAFTETTKATMGEAGIFTVPSDRK